MPVATSYLSDSFGALSPAAVPVRYVSPARPSLLRRILEALDASNQRSVERAVGRYIARNGGQLTDQLERDIAQRFGGAG